jgi:hypothetical protein
VDSLHVKRIGIEDLVGYIYIVRVDLEGMYGPIHSWFSSVPGKKIGSIAIADFCKRVQEQ